MPVPMKELKKDLFILDDPNGDKNIRLSGAPEKFDFGYSLQTRYDFSKYYQTLEGKRSGEPGVYVRTDMYLNGKYIGSFKNAGDARDFLKAKVRNEKAKQRPEPGSIQEAMRVFRGFYRKEPEKFKKNLVKFLINKYGAQGFVERLVKEALTGHTANYKDDGLILSITYLEDLDKKDMETLSK